MVPPQGAGTCIRGATWPAGRQNPLCTRTWVWSRRWRESWGLVVWVEINKAIAITSPVAQVRWPVAQPTRRPHPTPASLALVGGIRVLAPATGLGGLEQERRGGGATETGGLAWSHCRRYGREEEERARWN